MENKVLEAIDQARRALSLADIGKKTQLAAAQIRDALERLISRGEVIASRSGKYTTARLMKLILCRARVSAYRLAFARPLDGGAELYLDMPDEQAFDGDLVLVRETQGGERRRGELAKVVQRAHGVITGTLYIEQTPVRKRHGRSKGRPRYVPQARCIALLNDPRWPAQAEVQGGCGDAQSGDLCAFEVVTWPRRDGFMTVKFKQSLGRDSDLTAHLLALEAEHGIEEEFSPESLEEAAALGSDPEPRDMEGRLDLRDETIFTIDGADAQDFDDAVSLKQLEDGWELGVHIADVSSYVKPHSALDADARKRGTSVYLPGRTIPMLPEKLCNCLCSLMPGRDRLTLSAIMRFDAQLAQTRLDIRPSVIRSCARLTYDDVNALFAGKTNTVPEALHEDLKRMNELARRLKAQRVKQGSLELDVPEPEFTLDENGYPTDMGVRARGEAQSLIEEFMLAANRAIAAHARQTELPFPYRVHESPDSEKLEAMEGTLEALGRPVNIGRKPTQARLQQLLSAFEGTPQSAIVSQLVLRSMSKARYSEKPLGHYGLAFKNYCHFTSPIRRYPDLLAHRMLHMQMQKQIGEELALQLTASMHTLTEEASLCEEAAAQCERDADKLMCAAYLSKYGSKVMNATVTRFLKRGALVSLDNSCEGLIPFKFMDDVYSMDDEGVLMKGRASGRIVRLGERVRVKCVEADIFTGSISFRLLGPKERK